MANMINIAYLQDRLTYEPETGLLFWKDCAAMPNFWRKKYAGTEAFTTVNSRGYRAGKIDKVSLLAHRAIWAISFGEWPENQIDHINGCKIDNRIENLRVVTNQENLRNQTKRKSNTSGVTGVYWKKGAEKWRAQIMIDGKCVHLGYFDCLDEAAKIRIEALKKYGFSERHGT